MSMQGVDPIAQLVQMRTQQTTPPPGPIGPGQGMGAPQLGAPLPSTPDGARPSNPTNGEAQDVLGAFSNAAVGRGDVAKLAHHLREIQRMHPKLLLADHKDGHAELVGPAHDQFVAAAYARTHGAKVAHVRNTGRGQRLHLEF